MGLSWKDFAITKYINLPVFFFSVAIGIFVVCMTDPFQRKVYLYPSPDNIDILQYKDKTGACFVYEQTAVDCPAKTTKIKAQVERLSDLGFFVFFMENIQKSVDGWL
jgi:hypothetical protein